MSLYDALRAAAAHLAQAGIPTPDADAVELASFVLDVEPSEVRRRLVVRAELPAAQADRLAELVGSGPTASRCST